MIMEGEVMIEMISMITLSTIVLIADYDYFDDYLPREAIARRKRRSAEGARFAAHRCHQTLVRHLEYHVQIYWKSQIVKMKFTWAAAISNSACFC